MPMVDFKNEMTRSDIKWSPMADDQSTTN